MGAGKGPHLAVSWLQTGRSGAEHHGLRLGWRGGMLLQSDGGREKICPRERKLKTITPPESDIFGKLAWAGDAGMRLLAASDKEELCRDRSCPFFASLPCSQWADTRLFFRKGVAPDPSHPCKWWFRLGAASSGPMQSSDSPVPISSPTSLHWPWGTTCSK